MSPSDLLQRLGIPAATDGVPVLSPIDGAEIARLRETPPEAMPQVTAAATAAFQVWRQVPAPRRGELVRLLGEELRAAKGDLGRLVSLETGKILQEGLGEVQEMIDICDFAVGLSRQLYGLTMTSERPGHRMMETWHPLGPCGVISAFNFPVAVWSWNAALALVCGDPVIWKPSEKTPATALACQNIFNRAAARFGDAPDNLLQVVIGGKALGEALVESPDLPLISATGSTAMGREVGVKVAIRFGRSLLELGGNAAMIVRPSADLDMAVRAITFSAVGTCGQRCTSLRRLILHEDIYDNLLPRLVKAFGSAPIGNPLEDGTLIGPLVDKGAFDAMQAALERARGDGGIVHGGERVLADRYPGAYYVRPAIVEMPEQTEIVRTETFAPILYVLRHRSMEEALALHNGVPQGLSSCIFSSDLRECELFLSAIGSDCGIANVNIGPSGAEIGGAFGGEKETGGGRESGSDAWKAYMRRATNTINYSTELPLAQGIRFEIG
ncbi:aldehyde dehydrogenase family protein [Telmatospirillum sp. J64-1]|uniref:L-piperidine-6-carboxylate dehydrogenase n=1 Tax=Telmatospirillum sp. J64-1 TaxID=2502183 RepID=UPI00115D3CC2|nr:aldehyde dehydrogenase family protein [Telmatospirillum sp. J64-1]